jgi:hypothetical protein
MKTLMNEYVINQDKNNMTGRSKKAIIVLINFTLPQPKEEGEREYINVSCIL